jgi:hypothetical protein
MLAQAAPAEQSAFSGIDQAEHFRQLLQALPALGLLLHLQLQPSPRYFASLSSFCEADVLQSALLVDVHIAALAIDNLAVVHSNDSDFSHANVRVHPGTPWRSPASFATATPSRCASPPIWPMGARIWTPLIERVGDELRIRPVGRPIRGALKALASFAPGFHG